MSYSDPPEQHGSILALEDESTFSVWPGLLLHMVLCGAVLFVLGVCVEGSMDGAYDGGFSAMAYAFGSAGAAAAATIFALLIGVPFRLDQEVRRWWRRYGYVSWLFVAAGALVMYLAYNAGASGWGHYAGNHYGDIPAYDYYAPDGTILMLSWGLFAIGLAHLWFPTRRVREELRAGRRR